jgi:hypothetical protein
MVLKVSEYIETLYSRFSLLTNSICQGVEQVAFIMATYFTNKKLEIDFAYTFKCKNNAKSNGE